MLANFLNNSVLPGDLQRRYKRLDVKVVFNKTYYNNDDCKCGVYKFK